MPPQTPPNLNVDSSLHLNKIVTARNSIGAYFWNCYRIERLECDDSMDGVWTAGCEIFCGFALFPLEATRSIFEAFHGFALVLPEGVFAIAESAPA